MTPVSPFEVCVERHFSAAHHLLNYEGICENPHGHNFVVKIWARQDVLNEANIAVDYRVMKKSLDAILDKLDHTDLNENPEIGGQSPSSEYISQYIYQKLKPALPQLVRTCVYETPTCCSTYSED
jgi:6-pyruvoyltetrahydropterin/6-carboxytetrahydropterin synthase